MKKQTKKKSSKKAAKRSGVPETQLPSLVGAMAKLVERLESLERKTDQVLGRISNLPSEIRKTSQPFQPSHHPMLQPRPEHNSTHSQGETYNRQERIMYQAICADCRKNCEVPFKPGDRPVYCKECFAIRKAGHVPRDPDERHHKKPSYVPSALGPERIPTLTKDGDVTVFSKTSKRKSARRNGIKAKKKKR